MIKTKQESEIKFACHPTRKVFSSDDYKVYGVEVDPNEYPDIELNQYGNATICGNFHELGIGIKYEVKAISEITKYGTSYRIQNIKRDKPTSLSSTQEFLKEIVTPSQVVELMREYPDIVNKVINNDLEDIDLRKLHQIGEYRFNIIKEKIIDNFALVELVDKFKGTLSLAMIKALYIKYPSIEKILIELKNDPYKCLCRINRVGFKTADGILAEIEKMSKDNVKHGKEPIIDFGYDLLTSEQRNRACVMYLLEENETNGNTYMDIKELKQQSDKLAPACKDHFVDVIKNTEDIVFDKNVMGIAINHTYYMEVYIKDKILEALELDKKQNNQWKVEDYNKYRKIDGFDLSDEQMQTLPNTCNNTVSILNGSAGCGKSSSSLAVIDMLKDLNKSCLLLAPTGRASKIIAEYTKRPASTIHRGLEYTGEWGFNAECKLFYDIVMVDEFSMCDVDLFYHLISAIDFTKTKLVLIGDSSQLPSVGCGNCLHDLLSSKSIVSNILTKTFRFGVGGILTVATKIRNQERFIEDGVKPTIIGEDRGYMFFPTPQDIMLKRVVLLYQKLINDGKKPEDIMVLTAYNKGDYGTIELNKLLQPIANKNYGGTKHFDVGESVFYIDDLVMQCVNNYKALKYTNGDSSSKELMLIPNGELGVVIDINNIAGQDVMINKFDNDKIIYSKADVNMLKLAYSIGIHKSQGGSADTVILLTPKAHTYMLNSNLLYVAVTRARKQCYHFGGVNTVNLALTKKENYNRKTMLGYFLTKK
jgi:exodeoxyribonuclease V alpha subunit